MTGTNPHPNHAEKVDADLRAASFSLACHAPRRQVPLVLLLLFLTCPTIIHAAPDRVYLRDGRILDGQIVGERGGTYTFVAEAHQQIPDRKSVV